MANRDYFTRPNQGNGRDHHDYDRGSLGRRRPPRDPWMKPMLIAGALIALYFIWQFCR